MGEGLTILDEADPNFNNGETTMKIYKLVDDSPYYDMHVIGEFSTIEKAEEAKKNVEEYLETLAQLRVIKKPIEDRFNLWEIEHPYDRQLPDEDEWVRILTELSESGDMRKYSQMCDMHESASMEHINKNNRVVFEGFVATLTEKEAKLFKTHLNTSIELPLKIVEINLDLDYFKPMNISELKELV